MNRLIIFIVSGMLLLASGARAQQIVPGNVNQYLKGSAGIDYSHALLVGGIYVAIGATIASFLFVRRDVAN